MSASRLVVVLAAGKGTRMGSDKPKVLHEVARRPLVEHVLRASMELGDSRRAIVLGPDSEDAERLVQSVDKVASLHVQRERLGTGHAVAAARKAISPDTVVLVVFGDTPLISSDTLARMAAAIDDGASIAVLGFRPDDPTGYGRLVQKDGALVAIREHKDATPEERAITLCNGGAMAFGPGILLGLLDRLQNDNASGEYYLTDAVGIGRSDGLRITTVEGAVADAAGVNTPADLAEAEAMMQDRLRANAMAAGVTLVAPQTVHLAADTRLDRGVVVEPYVVFGPGVSVAPNARIFGFSHLEGATVGEGASVGPYARLRPGADLRAGSKVGNFVEVKGATLHEGAKAGHLTYIGDADVGANANLGAGTIFCNYDGYLKHRTTVGANAFVGSNSSLVAPVSVGEGAYVGSGSVITEDVPDNALAIGRGRQVVKPDRATAIRKTLAALKARLKGGHEG